MPLRAHLREFRNRLIYAAIGIAVGSVIGWFVYEPVFEALQAPIISAAQEQDALITVNFAGLATALDMKIKVSLFVGVVLSAPWWLYQLWAFVAPGLVKKEKRYTAGFLAAAIPLFAAGIALAWWVYPKAVSILTGFTPEGGSNFLDAQMLMTFTMRLFLAFGIAFVFPVVMVFLSWAGLVRTKTWLKGWRWAIVIIFIAAAMLTPTPDVVTMMSMAGPMVALYFGAIGVARLGEKRRDKKRAAAALDDAEA
ncbi:twin-arginine translocase subunit TatC [Demequina sediminicola]|uniref:twin-arginine translocase subunit TatC n=1 Tax=Demequina sediminicola TaxID=1095026 RepID=UPI00078151C9|nr:twin-arginine translocase subunit TatC [Demequina sediminicola]